MKSVFSIEVLFFAEECFYALMLVSLCLEYYILLMFQGQLYKTFFI